MSFLQPDGQTGPAHIPTRNQWLPPFTGQPDTSTTHAVWDDSVPLVVDHSAVGADGLTDEQRQAHEEYGG